MRCGGVGFVRDLKSRSDAVLTNQGPSPLFLPTRSLQLKPEVTSAKIPDGLLCAPLSLSLVLFDIRRGDSGP